MHIMLARTIYFRHLNMVIGVGGYTCSMRTLTSGQTATALRPFLFAVHPDLFGQHPRKRAVNEDSLKKLNEYVTALQAGRPVKPVEVTFHVRASSEEDETDQSLSSSALREIRLSLKSHDLTLVVKDILKSCNLPLDYVNEVQSDLSDSSFSRPIKWHHTYYTYTGKVNPEQAIRKAPGQTLRTWLRVNAERARDGQRATKPVKEEVDRVCSELKEKIGLAEIRWASPWDFRFFRGCLRSFEQIYKEHPERINSMLRGRTLVFSNSTGFCLHGDVFLSSEDVPTDWMKLIASVPAYDTVLSRLPYMEDQLSELLSNIQLIRRRHQQRLVTAPHYEVMLNRLINSLRRAQDNVTAKFFAEDLSHLELIIDSEEGPLTLTPMGQFIVPASQPASLVIDFISSNKTEAAYILSALPASLEKESSAVNECLAELELQSLLKDENITALQMVDCCERLLEHYLEFGHGLRDACLKISHYYSVLQDGQILIPWDWKLESDFS